MIKYNYFILWLLYITISIMEYKNETNSRGGNQQKSKDTVFESILSEYDSKRHFFNPNIRSPDLFRKKLKHRMKQYYSIIYKER